MAPNAYRRVRRTYSGLVCLIECTRTKFRAPPRANIGDMIV
jgi:hypothetical protein